MNREIKFRGKRIDNGEWVCGGYAENDGKAFVVVRTRYIPDTRDWDTVEYYENNPCYHLTMIDVDPDTVGQYIGVKDKNGKEIYEKDIVRTNSGRLCKVVWFSSPQYQGWDLMPIEVKNPVPKKRELWKDLEVIGNVYENADMLKGVE